MSPAAANGNAVELRTGLEELFGQDVFVAIRVTRSRLRGDPDFTQAAVSALSRNSNDLTRLVSQVYGSARADESVGSGKHGALGGPCEITRLRMREHTC